MKADKLVDAEIGGNEGRALNLEKVILLQTTSSCSAMTMTFLHPHARASLPLSLKFTPISHEA